MYKLNTKKNVITLLIATMLLNFGNAQFSSTTGSIDVKINLTGACQIAGVNADGTAPINLGEIDFGTTNTLNHSVPINATINSFIVKCSASVAPKFSIQSGLYDGEIATFLHAMKHTSETKYIGYNVFATAARTTPLTNDEIFFTSENNGIAQSVTLYGQTILDAQGAYIPGDYLDTLTVDIKF